MTIAKRAALNAVAGFACAAALCAAAGCAKHSDAGAAAAGQAQVLPVSAVPARIGTLTSTFALTGSVVPARQANLASVASGTILRVDAQIGDHVRAGQLLVQIDDSTLRAQLAQDEASLSEARARLRQTKSTNEGTALTTNSGLRSAQVAFDTAAADYRRNQQLFSQGYISQQAFDKSRSDYAAAQAALQAARVAAQNASMSSGPSSAAQADVASMTAAVDVDEAAAQAVLTQIAQAGVRAPFDGVVTQRNVDPGSLASPGTQLVQVSEMDPVYLDVGIPDGDLQYVRPGSESAVRVDALPGKTWRGTVNHLNAAAGQGTLTYLARIIIPNPDLALRAGMVGNVTFVSARSRNALIVPRGAIVASDAGNSVFVVDGGKAKLRPVTLGIETQSGAQISGAGLRPGTIVITQRPDALQDGSPVKVVSTNS